MSQRKFIEATIEPIKGKVFFVCINHRTGDKFYTTMITDLFERCFEESTNSRKRDQLDVECTDVGVQKLFDRLYLVNEAGYGFIEKKTEVKAKARAKLFKAKTN